jgi:hypothetical protein
MELPQEDFSLLNRFEPASRTSIFEKLSVTGLVAKWTNGPEPRTYLSHCLSGTHATDCCPAGRHSQF